MTGYETIVGTRRLWVQNRLGTHVYIHFSSNTELQPWKMISYCLWINWIISVIAAQRYDDPFFSLKENC